MLGTIMSVAPLGLGNYATSLWLPGAAVNPVVVLAWILLFGAPLAAGRPRAGPA